MAYRKPLTEEQLRDLRSEVKSIAEGLALIVEHVVITDADANILFANRGVEEATGFSIAEMLGKTPGDLWGGVMEREFFERMWRTIKEEKQPFIGEVQNRKKDGTLFWQELRISPVLDGHGAVRFFIGIEPDITVRKVFAEQTKQYLEELERLNAYLSGREVLIQELTEKVERLRGLLRAFRAQP